MPELAPVMTAIWSVSFKGDMAEPDGISHPWNLGYLFFSPGLWQMVGGLFQQVLRGLALNGGFAAVGVIGLMFAEMGSAMPRQNNPEAYNDFRNWMSAPRSSAGILRKVSLEASPSPPCQRMASSRLRARPSWR